LPGDTSKTVTVAINGDTEIEPDETFDVILSNAVNATIADNQGVGTIINDDFPPPTVSFDSTIYKEDESQTALLFVNRTGDLSGTTSVHFSTPVPQNLGVAGATGGASCAMGIDYITASGTLVFAPDVAQQEIQVQLCGDALREGFEYFPVTLSNVTNGTLGEISTASVEINDTASQFVNGESIGIGTSGDAYESTIEVAGAPSTIGSVRVTLYDFDYYQADNVDVLLVGPQGQKMLLMADAGGSGGLSDPATVTFDDTAGRVLPNEGTIATGKYEPTTWEPGQTSFTAPAPAGPYTEPGSAVGGTPSLGSVFGGTNANGTWRLYIRDDNNTFQQLGIGGSVAGGWGLSFVAPTAAGVSVSGLVRSGKMPIANVQVMISGGNLTQPMFTKTSSFGNYTFEGLTAGQTYVVTVVSRRYTFPQSAIVVTTVDNVSNADFEAEDR
jgi:hypothetical protein